MPTDSPNERDLVGVVHDTVYRIRFPRRTAQALVVLSLLVLVATGHWVHAGGLVMVILGASCATPTLNVANGCAVWIAIIVASALAWTMPAIGAPLAVWGVAAWLLGSVECRLTMTPHEKFEGEAHSGGYGALGVSPLAIGVLLAFALYMGMLASR